MRKGKIRFPLKLKDDAEARSLEELRENFDLEKIIQYYSDGSLERWLDCWMLTDEADKVRALDKADKAIGRALCEIFGIEPPEGAVDAEDISWRTERENRLKQYTGNKEILAKVDFVAFDTEDLYDILEEEDTDTIYLCNNSFNFNSGVLKHKNKRYIGIGKAEAVIGSKAPVDFEGLGIAFENVKFDEAYLNLCHDEKKDLQDIQKTTSSDFPLDKNSGEYYFNLGLKYENGYDGANIDENFALDMYEYAVKHFQYRPALLHLKELANKQNTEANERLEELIESGRINAMLSDDYDNKGREYYEKGYKYEHGIGVAKDINFAMAMYETAAKEYRNPEAMERLRK